MLALWLRTVLMLWFVASAFSRRQRHAVQQHVTGGSALKKGLLPGLGAPVHDVGDVGRFDETAMRALMARKERIAVKFDMAGGCAACKQIDKIWEMLAAARPGKAWSVNCGEHTNVCLMRQARVVAHPGEIPEPTIQLYDGKDFWRYVGPASAADLMPWLVAGIQGQDMASSRHTQLVDPLPLADIEIAQPLQTGVIAPLLYHYVRSHGRAKSPFHHEEGPSIWPSPGDEGPPPNEGLHDVPQVTFGIGVERHVRTVRLSWSPSIVLLPGFLDDAECDELIDLAQPLLRESSETREQSRGRRNDDPSEVLDGVEARVRIAETAVLSRGAERPDQSATLHNVMQRVHDLIGVPPDHGEPVHIHRYSGEDGLENVHAAASNSLPCAYTQSTRRRAACCVLRACLVCCCIRFDTLQHENVALCVRLPHRSRTHGFTAFLSTPLSGGEIIFPKVKSVDAAAERLDVPQYLHQSTCSASLGVSLCVPLSLSLSLWVCICVNVLQMYCPEQVYRQ